MSEIEYPNKKLPKDISFTEFVQLLKGTEMQPYQKQMLKNIESISTEEFRTQYMQQPFQVGKTFRNTKRKDRKEKCGDCTFFGDKGCTTSYLEAKWGSGNTPACNEFNPKILGTKSTYIILDDPMKEV